MYCEQNARQYIIQTVNKSPKVAAKFKYLSTKLKNKTSSYEKKIKSRLNSGNTYKEFITN